MAKEPTDKLCLMSEAYKQRRPPKQGFSGFPNEIFDDKRRSDCTDIVCDFQTTASGQEHFSKPKLENMQLGKFSVSLASLCTLPKTEMIN